MSLQERTPSIFTSHGHSHGSSIPKSILADRSHHLITGIENNSNLRVTFAKTPATKQFATSLASFHQNMYLNHNAKPGTSPPHLNAKSPAATTTEDMNRKLLFHSQDEEFNAKPRASSLQVDQVSPGAERVRRAYQLGKYKRGGSSGVDVLYPDKQGKPKSMKGSLSGALSLGKTESDESIGKKSRASVQSSTKSKSGSKKLKAKTKSITSSTSRKTKTKRKRKKSKKIDEELEKELIKPVELNQEYANELNKITQILKAVTAFDESTATKNGAVVTGSATSKNNANAFYTYAGGSDLDTGRSATSSTTKSQNHPRRPLSGEELKTLLSSITRVVSLHQLPVSNGSLGRLGTASKNATPPTTLNDNTEAEKVKAPVVSDPLGTLSAVSTSTTKSGKKKKKGGKKSKRVQPKYPTEIVDVNAEPKGRERSANSALNIKSKSKPELVRKAKSKSKTTTAQSTKPRIESDSSLDGLEKDPVKHAAFLRKYFEESVRLANKNSSEDLIAVAAEAAKTTPTASVPVPNSTPATATTTTTAVEEKPKKKVKKKKSVSKKDG